MAAVLDNFFSWLGTLILLVVAVTPFAAGFLIWALRSTED
jgi:hypothetical protein